MISVIEKEYMETVIRMGKRLQSGQPDWEQCRCDMALAIYLRRREFILSSREDDAKGAVEEANLLIAELKKTQEKK